MEYANDVTVIGTGRVGLPFALSLLEKGVKVNGIDVDKHIIESVAKKKMPFKEPGYEEIIKKYEFNLDDDYKKIADSKYIVITVGTPLQKHIETDINYITQVIDSITPYLKRQQTIILRSTVSPGTTEYVRRYLERKTGFNVGNGIYLAFCPERIAEGKAKEELETLPQIIGSADKESGKIAEVLFKNLVEDILHTDYISAELAKLFSNISRYIYFAVSNQFMILADEFGANIFEILKMSNYKYPRQIIAKPGFTAGACLRKDFGMINEHIPYMDMLLSAWKINEYVPHFLVDHMRSRSVIHGKRVAVLGYSFKQDSDDPRDSLTPKLIRYVEREVPKEVRICEPNMEMGLNLQNGYKNLPLKEALFDADIIFIAVNHSDFKNNFNGILELCKKETWFADVWNVSGMNKIFFQKMETGS